MDKGEGRMILFAVLCRGDGCAAGALAHAMEELVRIHEAYGGDYHWSLVDELTAGDEYCSTVVNDAVNAMATR